MRKVALIVGIVAPLVFLFSAVTSLITFDVAVSFVQLILGVSPGLLIIDNYRQKRGQNVVVMATLGSGLVSMGTMFVLMGLLLTGVATIVGGLVWSIVAMQAVVYDPARQKRKTREACAAINDLCTEPPCAGCDAEPSNTSED